MGYEMSRGEDDIQDINVIAGSAVAAPRLSVLLQVVLEAFNGAQETPRNPRVLDFGMPVLMQLVFFCLRNRISVCGPLPSGRASHSNLLKLAEVIRDIFEIIKFEISASRKEPVSSDALIFP